LAIISNEFVSIYFVFQIDDTWHVMKFNATRFISGVNTVKINFEKFPNQEISVKDLYVHTCPSTGMYVKFIKYMNII